MAASQPRPSSEDLALATDRASAMEKVARLRPTLEDYVSEGVIPHKPEGKYAIPVDGKRVLQMNEAANRAAAWFGDSLKEAPAKRVRREMLAEKRARKTHRARATIVVPEMPWKRKKAKRLYTEDD